MRRWMLVLALLPGWISAAAARPIGAIPYDKMLRDADLVVVATAVKSDDTKDMPATDWKLPWIGIDTTLTIQAVFKGERPEKLVVLHYRVKDGVGVPNGPLLVTFRPPASPLTGPDYLLFLKRRPDGRYEPLSGPIDPVLSVKEMVWPR